jgi:copper(I)-binding protein
VNFEPVTARRLGRRLGMRLGIGLALAAALATSACAAGQDAATAGEKPTIDGANSQVGPMKLLDIVVEPPKSGSLYASGSNMPLKLVLVNTGQQTDQLTSITSTAITSWGAFATTQEADAAMSASSSPASATSSPAPSSPTASTSSTPRRGRSAASSSSATSTSVPLPAPSRSITVASDSRVSWGTPDAKGALLLMQSTKAIYPGGLITLTFTFARAGSVTVDVPIGMVAFPSTSVVPAPSTSSIEG